MPADEDLGLELGSLLTATAELALLVRMPNAFARGAYATHLREQFDLLVGLLEAANDAISKERDGYE